ncbi:hypothetical protein DVH24_006832 [Malus domestica]|uniref:Mei2-like C-terminal RNA recognition motif domain-containing protein n=1 Tax=Malus domestica TaxID=3750 RepID=A0A498J863_MALDO|nr:hypothetical protein DVH24_006832 [Malus domestica]
MGSKPLNPMAEPFFLYRFHTPYFPARPVCAYSIVHQPRYFFCQMNPVQPGPTTNKRRRKSVKGKRSLASQRPRNPLKKLGDETHVVGAPRVVACVTKKDLPTGTTYAASYRQMKKGSVRGCGGVIPFPSSPDLENRSGPTTIMIKNIPNQFQYTLSQFMVFCWHITVLWLFYVHAITVGKINSQMCRRCDLLTVLRNHCRDENLRACREGVSTKSEFDFVYLPMDFKQFWNHKRTANLGYAFVNFTSFTGAYRFYKKFHNEQWKVRSNKKTCEITSAKIQGLEALKKNFESKVFWCHTEEYLPAVVEPPSDGVLRQPKVTPVGTRVGLPFVDYREVPTAADVVK